MDSSQECIDELVRRVLEVTQPLRIVLFGSAARGTMGTSSDLDVLVVVPEGVARRRTAQAIYRNLIGFERAADVVVATKSDLQAHRDNFSLVYHSALKEGREVYAA